MNRRTVHKEELAEESIVLSNKKKIGQHNILNMQKVLEKIYLILWTLFSIYSIYRLTRGRMDIEVKVMIGVLDAFAFAFCGYVCYRLMKIQENVIIYGTFRIPEDEILVLEENNE